MKIITNNPIVARDIEDVTVEFIDGGYKDVLLAVHRLIVEQSMVLLTHPLSGSIKPNETIYKSIIVEDQSKPVLNMESLQMIEHALDVYDSFQSNRETPQWIDRVLEDFAVVDFHIIQGALSQIQIPPQYL